MSLSYFSPQVALNIQWEGQYNALSLNELNNISNNQKYLKNDNGDLSWNGELPIAPNDITKNDYQLVYDFPTNSFKLKNLLPLYDVRGDNNRLYIYQFSPSTFTGGTIYEAGGKTAFNTSTLYGTFALTDNNRGVLMNNNSLAGFKIPNGKNSGYSKNWSISFMINSQLVTQGQIGNTNIQLITGNGQVTNYIYNLSNDVNSSYYTFDNDGGPPAGFSGTYTNINNILPQNQITILTYANINDVLYIYLNGVLKEQSPFLCVLSSLADVFFSGNPSSGFNQFVGILYCVVSLQDSTIAKLQKAEGYMRWDARYNDLVFNLDVNHPYYATPPRI